MSYLLENKEAKAILKNLKISFECKDSLKELGNDNGKEFGNKLP